jgi:hypothetical protein
MIERAKSSNVFSQSVSNSAIDIRDPKSDLSQNGKKTCGWAPTIPKNKKTMLNSQHTETEEDQEEDGINDFQYQLLDGKLKDTILTYRQASQTP